MEENGSLILARAKSLVTGFIDFGCSSGKVLRRSKLVGVVAGKLCEVSRGSTRDFFDVGCNGVPTALFIDCV